MNLVIIMTDESIQRTPLQSVRRQWRTSDPPPPIEKLIRTARRHGITNVYCAIDAEDEDLYTYLSTANFQVPVHCVLRSARSPLLGLFALEPLLRKASFFLAMLNTEVNEEEIAEFIAAAELSHAADGILTVTNSRNDAYPVCVALNGHDTILKFSDSKDGYNWAVGGLFYFSQRIFDEKERAVEMGLLTLRDFFWLLCARGYVLQAVPDESDVLSDD